MTVLAVAETRAREIAQRLLADAPLESGCFCLLYREPRGGAVRYVLGEPLALDESWTSQAEQRLTPSGQTISAAVTAAQNAGSGLAFIHTHPMTRGWSRLSDIDIDTSLRLRKVFADLLDGPYASLVISGTADWAAWLVEDDHPVVLDVDVVGRHLGLHRPPRSDSATGAPLDDRQARALGIMGNNALRELRVGVVGAGGLGSPVAETLTRMGVRALTLVDYDLLDTPSNARRIFGVSRHDVEASRPRHKAEVVAEYLTSLELGSVVRAVVADVRTPEGQQALMDCDIVVNGTDTHGSRAALTELCVRAQLLLVDVGVRVGTRGGALDALIFERRVQLPDGPCLWCWGRLDPERIRLEAMPAQWRDQLVAEGYIVGMDAGPAPSVAALTVTAAGAASSAVLALVAGGFDVADLVVTVDALTLQSQAVPANEPDPECICRRWRR